MRTFVTVLLCFFGLGLCRAEDPKSNDETNPKSVDEWYAGYLIKQAMEAFVKRAIAENEEHPAGPDDLVLIAVTNEHLAGAVAIFRPPLTKDNKLHALRFERKLDGINVVPIDTQSSFEEIVELADRLIEKTEQVENPKAEGAFEELRVYRSTNRDSKSFKQHFPREEGLFKKVVEEILFPEPGKQE